MCSFCATTLQRSATVRPPKTPRIAPEYPSPAIRGRSIPSPCGAGHSRSESARAPRPATCRAGPPDRRPSAARRASILPCACRTRYSPWATTLPAFKRPASPLARVPELHSPPMTCHACGAQLSSTARFCHKCGATVATVSATGWRAGLPWALAGAALGALIAVVAMRASAPSPARNDEPAAPFASSGGGRPPDISQMSPKERANRLFDRVMMLAEAGKTDSVQFFLPMALGAYAQLPSLDADAHYDVGMLELAGGDPDAALAEADTIRQSTPTHLFIYILRAHAYQALANKALEQKAYADFLRHEQAELAVKRSEYDDYREALTNFHSEAQRQAQSPRRPTS